MSKVKIQGNASGTGVLTVTAPNTSTDRTITLPDSTGTLATTADVPSSITDNGDATAITIDSSERVGIGTGSPSEPLHVAGSGNSTKIRIQNTKSGTTTGAELEMVSEDGTWQLGQGRGSLHDGDDEDFHIYNSGTKLWIKKTNGNVYIPSGNLVLGSGLTIGGTGAANTLDDYEEGNHSSSWTTGNSGSITMGRNSMAYVKVGKVVTITGEFDVGSVSSPVGGVRVSLPFAIASHTSERNMSFVTRAGMYHVPHHEDNPPLFIGHGGTSIIEGIYERDDNSFVDYNPQAGETIWLCFSYFTDS